jgi:Ca-activated chloride channel family protein
MMSRKWSLAILLALLMAVIPLQGVLADGIIVPDPPVPCTVGICPTLSVPFPMEQLNIRYHHVTVKIDNQVAVTHVDQVFENPNPWTVEGTYIFPLPVDAVVSNFILWIDGKAVEGKVLDAQEARRTYEDIVRSMRDPALLEYIGRGAVQARVFPIPAGGERRIELEYSQVLTAQNGLVKYSYPLNTEKFSAKPLESVSITVEANSQEAVRAVYSSSHNVAITRVGDRHFTASYEENNVLPDKDFTLYYSMGESEAFHLFSYRDPLDPQDQDGFFLLLLAPKPGEDSGKVSKDVILVLDRSGSMEGEKFTQAQNALKYILGKLNSQDRFFLLAFSSDMQTYTRGLRPASEAGEAIKWVDRLSAAGSTDINRALQEASAVADRERPTYLIFLTDGLPTVGVVDSTQILNDFGKSAPDNIRLFSFGVGYDVDTYLLDSLSQEHHGLSSYVQPGQELTEVLSDFYSRISTPVLTNISLDFGSLPVYDLYPNPLPDFFAGSQVVVAGRYRKGGVVNVTLSGEVNGKVQTFRYSEQDFSQDSLAKADAMKELPRLWATRKIGYLLQQIRLKGPDQETIDQIVKLSIRYGIITPYTSFLVTEDAPLGVEEQDRIAQDTFNELLAAPTQAVSGEGAVQKAADQGAMSQADVAPSVSIESSAQVKQLGNRAFLFKDGVWLDTAYDAQTMKTVKVSFLSDDYFKLADSSDELRAALSLGDRVIVVSGGRAYEVVTQGQDVPVLQVTPQAQDESNPPVDGLIPTLTPEVRQGDPTPAAAPLCASALLALLPLLPVGVWWMKRR